MRYLTIVFGIITILAGIILSFLAPDPLSISITCLMTVLVFAGVLFGIVKDMLFFQDFKRASEQIIRTTSWSHILEKDNIFHQKELSEIFDRYKEKADQQRNSGQVIHDIEDSFNEDILAISSRQSLILQIPGTLTSLGILGTFIGLIIGLRHVEFQDAETAMTSIVTLLNGIETAFYTSICGVILSILFNIIHKASWNMLMREMNRFTFLFHSKVVPPADEQERFREKQNNTRIIGLLEVLVNKSDQKENEEKKYEQILMPQIADGLKKQQFVCCYEPIFNLIDKSVTKLKVVVKWKHPKLGLLPSSVFMPTVIHTGYGAKLERYIWEEMFSDIKNWISQGYRPIPVIMSITKNGLFSKDAPEAMIHLTKKYQVPPKYIYTGIPQEVYTDLLEIAKDIETRFLNGGFNICIDEFDGNLFPVITNENIHADMVMVDSMVAGGNYNKLIEIYHEAEVSKLTVVAQNIKSMEQLSDLRKVGFREGCGPHFADAVEALDAEKFLPGGRKEENIIEEKE